MNFTPDTAKIAAFLRHKINHYRVLVLGDVMLDRYYFGEVKRISPEAPVPVALVKQIKDVLGGAANVCSNLALLGCQVEIAGVTGNDITRARLSELLKERNIAEDGLLMLNDRPTISKTRVMGGHQQIIRLDFEDNSPIAKKTEQQLKTYLGDRLQQVDVVVISDYAKGVCTQGLCQFLIKESNQRQIPLIIDPKGSNWNKYKGAYMVTPNLKELAEAVGYSAAANSDAIVNSLSAKLRSKYALANLLVTRSEQGLSLLNADGQFHIPTTAQEVFDVSGAGDTVVAAMAAALAGKLDQRQAAWFANLAAGVVVGKLGTYAITNREALEAVEHYQGLLAEAAITTNI